MEGLPKCYRVWYRDDSARLLDCMSAEEAKRQGEMRARLDSGLEASDPHCVVVKVECLDH